jgi:nitrate/nitrite transporter NarK
MKYRLLSFLCAVTVVAYLQRSALSVPSERIERDLGIGPSDMGLVWLAWYAGYAAFQLPAGAVAERLGSKTALILFAVLWSALTALTGTASSFTELWLLWGAMGTAQAGIFVCATKGIGATFPKTEQAFASGALGCCMAGGAALSMYVTGRLVGELTWPQILVVYAVPGLVWAVAFALVVPRPDPPAAPSPDLSRPPTPWGRLLTHRDLLLLSGQQFLRAGATALFFTWFPRYLQEAFGVTKEESGTLAAYPLVVGVFGGLLGGTLSDWLLRKTGSEWLSRQGLSATGTAVCAAASVGAYFAPSAEAVVVLVSAAGFCAYVSGAGAYAVALSMGGARVAPVFATMNMAGNVGAGLFPFAVGRVVGGTGNWNLTLLLFAGMFAGSTLCWLRMDSKAELFEDAQ